MLKQLNVRNFALIHEASLNFDSGYTVITGETGSGKSILLNALNLLLGERADFKVIGQNGDKAVVEAVFEIDTIVFSGFFTSHDIDCENQSIVRREITTQGRSRAFINDTPVQLNVLKEFTERLISIHSQYNTLDLKRKDFQLNTLDVLAETAKIHSDYLTVFEESKRLTKAIEVDKEQLFQLEKDKDYNDFQLKELEELQLEKNNFSDLEERLSVIENATEIKQLLNGLANGLGGDGAIIDQVQSLRSYASKLTKIDVKFNSVEQRIQSVVIELKDLEEELNNNLNQSEEMDEERKLEITALLDRFNHILLKHKCNDQEELIALYQSLQNTSSDTESLRDKIAVQEKELSSLNEGLLKLANQLHEKRQKSIPEIEKNIQNLLTELKLPETRLVFKLEQTEKLSAHGNSNLSILFSANKGIAPVEIEKAASGGELSRVMLGLQKLISEKTKLPTIFFDEIDTGVSGDVAQKMGILLHQMGQNMQLFAISHLPQVAAKANYHLKVEKTSTKDSTETIISALSHEKRVEEIARLMSGEIISEAAISNAKALMV